MRSITWPDFGGYKEDFQFNTREHPDYYAVEGVDALELADSLSSTLIRYRENNASAGILYQRGESGVVAMGFPFESIVNQNERDHIMEVLLGRLLKNEEHE